MKTAIKYTLRVLTVFSFALTARADLPSTAECRDFMDFATGAKSDSAYVTSDREALPNLKTTSVAVSFGGENTISMV